MNAFLFAVGKSIADLEILGALVHKTFCVIEARPGGGLERECGGPGSRDRSAPALGRDDWRATSSH